MNIATSNRTSFQKFWIKGCNIHFSPHLLLKHFPRRDEPNSHAAALGKKNLSCLPRHGEKQNKRNEMNTLSDMPKSETASLGDRCFPVCFILISHLENNINWVHFLERHNEIQGRNRQSPHFALSF